jgi:hypothetical protein
MNLVIIPIDGAVYVDGYSFSGLDLSIVPSDVHALQWKNDKGWLEFKDLDNSTKPPNQDITELPSWANTCKTKWDEAHVNYLKEQEDIKKAQEPIPSTVI